MRKQASSNNYNLVNFQLQKRYNFNTSRTHVLTPKSLVMITEPTPASEESAYYFLRKLGLSHRETDIVKALLVLKSDKDIANKLNIAVSTVHSHRTAIYAKTKTNDRASLIIYLINKGFFRDVPSHSL